MGSELRGAEGVVELCLCEGVAVLSSRHRRVEGVAPLEHVCRAGTRMMSRFIEKNTKVHIPNDLIASHVRAIHASIRISSGIVIVKKSNSRRHHQKVHHQHLILSSIPAFLDRKVPCEWLSPAKSKMVVCQTKRVFTRSAHAATAETWGVRVRECPIGWAHETIRTHHTILDS